MSTLAREFGPRGVLFLGVHSDPDLTPAAAATHAREFGLEFPVLLDPTGGVAPGQRAGDAGGSRPRADGQIYYRGRIDDRYAPDGRHRPTAQLRELEAALAAILAGESPLVTRTRAFGCPLFLRSEVQDPKRADTDHIRAARGADPLEPLCTVPPPGRGGAISAPLVQGRRQAGGFHARRDVGWPDAAVEAASGRRRVSRCGAAVGHRDRHASALGRIRPQGGRPRAPGPQPRHSPTAGSSVRPT